MNPDKRNSKNRDFVENVACIDVKRTVKAIVERSFILEDMHENGEIGLIGGMHSLDSGLVEFFEDTKVFGMADVLRVRGK